MEVISTFVAKGKSLALQWSTIISNFSNLLDFGFSGLRCQSCGKSFVLQIQMHPSGNYKSTSNSVEMENILLLIANIYFTESSECAIMLRPIISVGFS